MLSLDTAYRSFGGEVEASSTPTICRLPDSRRHQLSAIARSLQQRTGCAVTRKFKLSALGRHLPRLHFNLMRVMCHPGNSHFL